MTEQKTEQVSFSYDFEEVINSIRHLKEVNIKATERGIEFFGVNESNTMMSEVLIDKEKLNKYNLSKEFQITTDIDYIKILKRFALVKAYIQENMMSFDKENDVKINMPVFSKTTREKPILNLKKAVSFDLSNTEVRKTLKDIESLGTDAFYLEFKDNRAVFTATGGYGIGGTEFTKILKPYDRGIQIYEKGQDSIKVYISLELFRNALNGMSSKTRITLAENSPIIVENTKSDYENPNKKVTHYIAPRYYEENKSDEEQMVEKDEETEEEKTDEEIEESEEE